MNRWTNESIIAAFKTLGLDDRKLLLLRYKRGLSQRQAATLLRLPRPVMAQREKQALRNLEAALG